MTHPGLSRFMAIGTPFVGALVSACALMILAASAYAISEIVITSAVVCLGIAILVFASHVRHVSTRIA